MAFRGLAGTDFRRFVLRIFRGHQNSLETQSGGAQSTARHMIGTSWDLGLSGSKTLLLEQAGDLFLPTSRW